MKDIKNTTQKKYRDYSKTPGSPDNDFLFMYSVARLGNRRFVKTKCIDLIYIPLMKEHMLVSARFLSTSMKSLSLLPCW
uniref:Uncharacterized protein n=12 Tax=Simiiformes TaxID=314293 RepID=A0A2K5RMD7_CEBIM